MVYSKTLRTVLGLAAASTMALSTVVLPANAQANTTATLTVTPGSLTMYAADATDNNDLCVSGTNDTITVVNDAGGEVSLGCTDAEHAVSFSAISVKATRQTTTTVLHDTLFEDLTGSELNRYTVSVAFGDLINGSGGSNIVLGANPDGAGNEDGAIAYAPSDGSLFCHFDPTELNPLAPSDPGYDADYKAIKGIAPAAAGLEANMALFQPASASTVTEAGGTPSDVFGNATAALAGRYDIDDVRYECRLPAYLDAGTYTQVLSYTVAAS
jgi:hypothetical protein